jgi:outer membrane protein assembly complex protein YaeT
MAREDSSSPSSPARRHRVFRIVAIVGVVLAALVAAAVVVFHTDPARRYVVSQVTDLLAEQQIEFSTDELRYNLLDLSVSLRNVRIRSDHPDAPPLATIDALSANLGARQLIRGRYVLSGSADGVDLHYFVDEDGNDNLPRPPRDPDDPSEPLDYLIDDLAITNARVRYENRQQDIDLALPVSSITVSGNALTDRHAVTLEAGGGSLRVQDRTTPLDRLHGEIDLGRDDLNITHLELTSDQSRLAMTGSVRDFEQPQLDVALDGTVDAAEAAALGGVTDPVSGTVAIDATVRGELDALAINADVTGTNLRFREITGVQLAATGAYDMQAQRADVSSLQLRTPFGAVDGEGSVALEGRGASRVQATVSGLDAGTLMRTLDLDYVVASRVDARVDATWPGLEYLNASGSARAALTPTTTRVSPSVMPVGGRVDVDADAGRIVARLQDVRAAGAELGGRVTLVDQERLGGTVQARASDLAGVVSSAEAFLGRPRGSLLPTPISGPVAIDAQLGGTVQAPEATAAIRAPDLTVGEADDIAVAGRMTYTPAAVTIHNLDLGWQQAQAHASGRIALEGPGRMDLTVWGEALEVPALLAAVDQADVPAAGTVSFQGRVSGTMEQPTAQVTIRGEGLAAYHELLGTLTAEADVRGRDVVLRELVLDKPQPDADGRLTATAQYHLDRQSYTFDLQSDNLQLLTATLPDGQPLRGNVELAARGTGTVADPRANVDLAVDDLRVGEYDLGRIVADAVIANQQATITAAADQFAVDANVVIGVEAPYPATARLNIAGLDLGALPLDLGTELDGEVRATVDASGPLANPDRGEATATIEAFSGTWQGQPFSVDAPAVVRYGNERLGIDRLRLVAQDSFVQVTGELPLTARAGRGSLEIDALGNLATLARYVPADMPVAADGTLTLAGTIEGHLQAIEPDLTIAIDEGLIVSPDLDPGVSNLTLRARVSGGAATIEQLDANWGAATVTASGRIPFEVFPELPIGLRGAGGPATFEAVVQGLDPSTLPGAPAGLSGLISVNAELAANRADLAAVTGVITFPELRIALDTLTLAQDQVSTIRFADGAATIEQLNLSGTVGTLEAAGRVALVDTRAIDVAVNGNLSVGALAAFADGVRADGDTIVRIAARGTLDDPLLDGFIEMTDATVLIDEPTIAAERLSARLDLDGTRMTLSRLDAEVNGGTLTGSGFLAIGGGGIADIDLEFATSDFAFDAPLDLRSLSDATIRVTQRGEDILVEGKVVIDEAGLTGDINFDTGLLAVITGPRQLDLTEERNPLLERVQFNVQVTTATPILIDNNIARAEVTTDLRVLGTPYETGLSGRLTLLEGGEIVLAERRYEVDRGVITFLDERRIEPSFDLQLHTSVRNYDVTIAVSGTPGETETSLTSNPVLPEPDIMAMLVTGRTLDEMRGEEFEIAREQVLSYLGGRVGSRLGRGIERVTGLSEVRLEPQMIANEADPGARLTVGQEITDDLTLIYSTNLTDSSDQIWVAEYDVTRRFQTRTVRQSDNSYRFDFRHDVRFGGHPAPRREPRQRPILTALTVEGNAVTPEAELRALLRIEEGRPYDFFEVRRGVDRIEDVYRERGYLESRVRLDRDADRRSVTLRLRVDPGPHVDVQFAGATPPRRVVQEVRRQWHRGVFDLQRADDTVESLRAWLMDDNYLQPQIAYAIEEIGPDSRRVVFEIDPGTRFRRVDLAFEGAEAIPADELEDIISDQRLERRLFTDPIVVTELLERYYREQGYLAARIDQPRYEFEGTTARIVLDVLEGPRFTIRDVSITGNAVIPTEQLLENVPAVVGDPFLPAVAERSRDRIRQMYWRRGYNAARSDHELVVDRERAQVELRFAIREGLQAVIADIAVEGTDRTSDGLVREQLELEPGQPLDLGALSRSRRNLYDIGAFSIVDITRQPVAGDLDATEAADPSAASEGQQPVRVTVSVREVQPFQIRYGASYDTERSLGGIFDVSTHNVLGRARILGLRSRYDAQRREARLYMNQPALRDFPIQLLGSVYYTEERGRESNLLDPYNTDRWGLSVQAERELREEYVWNVGFRFEQARTFDPAPGGLLDEHSRVTPLSSSITREARDQVLDATAGSFLSHALLYSPSWLGADRPFVKYFGQYFHYVPLQPERRERFTHEIIRPRLVFATGIRAGLAWGIGMPLPQSERFFAGGSTTLRGFEQNAVGPIGVDRLPRGGHAMLVLNNELRFPLISFFDGVGFLDIGNVFPRVGDLSLTELRRSAGVGLRARTPWFLIRGDLGFPLDRRTGETRSRFYFSIGQAF